MEQDKLKSGHDGCHLDETGQRLIEEGKRLQVEGQRLESEGERLIVEGKRVEEEGHRIAHDHHEDKEKDLFIFVNRIRFAETQGVKKIMSVDAIAALVGLTSETAIVRRLLCGDDTSDPLSGEQKIKPGDQFVVTRKRVEGGFQSRVETELSLLREAAQVVEFIQGPTSYVIYKNVPTMSKQRVDVIVQVPAGYPAAMIDRAGLPSHSPLVNQVKGSPQEVVQAGGRSWRMISYHPHAGGGGLPWDPRVHGFHTYLAEVLAWLEVGK